MDRCNIFWSLGLIIILGFLSNGCPPPPPGRVLETLDCREIRIDNNCKKLQAKYDPSEYILTFHDTIDCNKRVEVLNRLRALGHEVQKNCGCNDMVLIKIPPELNFNEQIAEAEDEIEDTGDPGDISKNILISLGPDSGDSPGIVTIDTALFYPANQDSVVVGIVDLGMDLGHYALENMIWFNPSPNTDCFVDDTVTYDFYNMTAREVKTSLSHATHIGGIIGLEDPGPGRYNYTNAKENLRLMSLKISDGNTRNTDLFSAICAIKYAVRRNVDILNLSWGYYACEAHPALANALLEARDSSVLIVAAAGNDQTNIDSCHFWPAAFSEIYPHVISVSAVGNPPDDTKLASSFSNYGQVIVKVSAPGDEICSATNGNKCGRMTGTSMAAPFVSRMAAILKLANPGFTPDQIRNEIVTHAVPISPYNGIPHIKVPLENDLICPTCP